MVDLKLMLLFDAMMRERSVTAAARLLGIGQPAASNALARLRSLMKDELFIRTGGVMQPTAQALELSRSVEPALAMLRSAIASSPFNPAEAERKFRVSAGDYASTMLLPDLIERVRAQAPKVDLRFRFVEKDMIPRFLDEGEIDLAIGVFNSPPKRFQLEPLMRERFVSVMRRGHPDAAGLTLARFADLPHVLVTERGDETGAVDDILRGFGLRRRVAVTVSHVSLIPAIVGANDLVATIGERAARRFAASGTIDVLPLPFDMPTWQLSLLTPRQASGDLGLVWLVNQLKASAV
jgi:DNA-binding transcriptional LysR family regulator